MKNKPYNTHTPYAAMTLFSYNVLQTLELPQTYLICKEQLLNLGWCYHMLQNSGRKERLNLLLTKLPSPGLQKPGLPGCIL